ncbi:unnamed protein product, partial [Pylaiella littoralis]
DNFTDEQAEKFEGWLNGKKSGMDAVDRFSTVEGFKDLFKRLHTFALSADQATVS